MHLTINYIPYPKNKIDRMIRFNDISRKLGISILFLLLAMKATLIQKNEGKVIISLSFSSLNTLDDRQDLLGLHINDH